MNRNAILLIFDIDGTLVESGGLGRIALEKASEDLYGIRQSTLGIKPYGMTDPMIFRLILENNSIQINSFDQEFDRFMEVYLRHLKELLWQSDKPRLHDGVRNMLDQLRQNDQIGLALGTGNIREGARLKLERHGVNDIFPAGGYGSDSEYRDKIISAAYKRACDHYHFCFPKYQTWVIGDSPKDIEAGKSFGVNTLGVSNSVYSTKELAAFEPEAILESFAAYETFMNIILHNSGDEIADSEKTVKPVIEIDGKPAH